MMRRWLALGMMLCAPVVAHAQSGRPIVLLVHGRGYLTRDSAAFRRESLSALRESAFRATGDSLLADSDLRLVWYADLMDARRRDSRSTASCEAADRKTSEDSP